MMYSDEIYMNCHCDECERNRRIIIREFLEEKIKYNERDWEDYLEKEFGKEQEYLKYLLEELEGEE